MGDLIKETPYSEITATLEVLDSLKVKREHFRKIRSDPFYASQIAYAICEKWGTNPKFFTWYKRVRKLLGDNCFGPEEWATYYDARLHYKLMEESPFPWDESILNAPCPFTKGKTIKETHFAFFGLMLSIKDWKKIHPASSSHPRFYNYKSWEDGYDFSKMEYCYSRWYLMPIKKTVEVREDRGREAYSQLVNMLPDEYEPARVVEEVTKLFLYSRKTSLYAYTNANLCKRPENFRSEIRVSHLFNSGISLISGDAVSDDRTFSVSVLRKLPAGTKVYDYFLPDIPQLEQ